MKPKPIPERKVVVCEDRDALNRAAAEFCESAARYAIADRGRCMVSLSGGSTPKSLYALLAKPEWSARFDWSRIHFFWGDERCVAIDHPDSNYGMVERELLSKVPIPKENVHRFPTELGDPEKIAAAYEEGLLQAFGARSGEVPQLDLVLLGLGENGHTASLFPHCPALHESKRLIAEDYVAEVKAYRLTMTLPLINAARQIVFLVSGAGKAQVVNDVLNGPRDPEKLPAQFIAPSNGALTWMVDREAAAQIAAV